MADRQSKTSKRLASKPREQFKTEERIKVELKKTNAQTTVDATRIHRHKVDTKRHDPLYQISVHQDQEGHRFNLKLVGILDQAIKKHGRNFLKFR